jgi:hypothetical protein
MHAKPESKLELDTPSDKCMSEPNLATQKERDGFPDIRIFVSEMNKALKDPTWILNLCACPGIHRGYDDRGKICPDCHVLVCQIKFKEKDRITSALSIINEEGKVHKKDPLEATRLRCKWLQSMINEGNIIEQNPDEAARIRLKLLESLKC